MTDSLVSGRSGSREDLPGPGDDRHDPAEPVVPEETGGNGRAGPGQPDSSSSRTGHKDPLLDLVRIAAIGRVVLWHTWAWAWLTWIPAMPAMFFVTGALLEGSVGRRGWAATLWPRLKRLLIPYWVYGASCWALMLVDGWRPWDGGRRILLEHLGKWVFPLLDPVGSEDMPGLWIPLWYLRAYLWFLLLAGVLAFVWRRMGVWSVLLATGVAAGTGYAVWEGHLEVSQAVGDGITYLPFVLAGMGYWATRRMPPPRVLLPAGLLAAAGAVVAWQTLGLEDGVVNSSYLQTLIVGVAGVALIFGLRNHLLAVTDRWSGGIKRLNNRALTIYLWHGMGLVAAQRLVDLRMDAGPLRTVLALVVVLAVVGAAVVVFGPVEDLAAGRRSLRDLRPSPAAPAGRVRVFLRASVAVATGTAVVAAALVVGVPDGARIDGPLSGQAVVTRGALIEDALNGRGAERVDVSGMTPQEVLEDWVEENRGMLDGVGISYVDGGVATPSGELIGIGWYGDGTELPEWDTVAWWSMTKTVTSAWLVHLADEGVVDLDDPLSEYVDHTPGADDMTLRQLANHTSGAPLQTDGNLVDADPAQEVGEFVERGEVEFEPGTEYGYSRVGYFLLAMALERASGQTWGDAVAEMADEAGVEISLDDWSADWRDEEVPVSDPDGHGYRGGLWSAGGIVSTTEQGAGLLHWIFTEGLSDAAVGNMTEFPTDEGRNYYGLGLVPLCPCEVDGGYVDAERVGLDTASGTFALDLDSGATAMLRPQTWWTEDGPVSEFYDLQQRLLDSVTQP